MKRNYMKAAAGICALSLVLNGMTMPVQAKDQFSTVSVITSAEAEVPTEGTCGENTVWKFTEDGTLEISGTGEFGGWSDEECPWNGFIESVKKIVIGEGVTAPALHYDIFRNMINVESISLPSTYTYDVDFIFSYCESLKEIIVSEENEVFTSIDGIMYSKNLKKIVVIPPAYDKTPVFVVPDTVVRLDYYALINCTGITEIVVHENVNYIFGLEGCCNMEKWTVAEGNETFASVDGILYSKDLKTLLHCPAKIPSGVFVIPDGVERIETLAFHQCKGLTGVEFPESIKEMGGRVFDESGLTSITFPDALSVIEGGTFEKCTELTDVILHDGITVIYDHAFYRCEKLESIFIPEQVTEVYRYAFAYCDSMKEITFPDSVLKIGNNSADSFDFDLRRDIIIMNPECEIYDSRYNFGYDPVIYGYPESTAEAYADKYGYEFRSLIYGESVTTTPTTTTVTETTTTTTDTTTSASETTTATTTSWVLTGSEGMQTTTVTTTTVDNWEDGDSGKIGDFYYTTQFDGTLSIEYAGTDAYVEIPAEINGRKVSVVAAEAFRYNENVEHVVIPDGVTEIQPGAFMNCSNLKSVVIPESVSEINEDTFLGCDSLESLTIENPECIIHMQRRS